MTQRRIRYVKNGEDVNAGVVGRPTRDLSSNVDNLSDRLTQAELGEAVIAYDQLLATSCLPGMPVFWNQLTEQFEPALAAALTDPTTQHLVAAPSTFVLGVVKLKAQPHIGDVVLFGKATVDIAPLIPGSGPVVPGTYFLSMTAPGGLTRQRPEIGIPVLTAIAGGAVFVHPAWRDFLESHVHYRFVLAMVPAGEYTPPASGQPVTITSPSALLPGWLPASHASFNGKAPSAAKFGYNIAMDPGHLADVFPPLPPESAVLYLDRGTGTGGGLVGSDLVQVDRYGIWWMSDCAGEIPWPADYDPDAVPPSCPATRPELTLAFASMVFSTDKSVVTRLRIAQGSPLTLVDCHGNPATAGDLELGLDAAFTVATTTATGSLAVKGVTGLQFNVGPIVEGLKAGTNAHLTSTLPATLNDGSVLHQGRVTIDFLPGQGDLEIAPEIVRLGRSQERFYQEWPTFSFPAGRVTDLWLRYSIPPTGLPTSPKLKLRLVLSGTLAGTVPVLSVNCRQLHRPVTNPLPLPAANAAVNLTLESGDPLFSNQAVEVESSLVDVAPGDTVIIKIERSASDGYAGELLALRLGGVVTGG
jgi:hypothetical protein